MYSRIFFWALLFVCCFSCKDRHTEVVENREPQKVAIKAVEPTSLYEDLEGNPINLDEFQGKRIVLNFWATWCRPCIEEMPSLLRAQEQLEEKGYVFLLASDQSVKTIKAFKAKKNFDFEFIRLTGSFAELKIKALPVTYFYNTQGEKVDEISGGVEWDSEEMIARLLKVQ